jgi:flagellar basal-body rod protein FlgB
LQSGIQVALPNEKILEGPMTFNLLNKTNVSFLKSTLDAYSTRHQAIAENMSNVETRDYKPVEVNFEENLRRVMDKNRPVGLTSDKRHISIGGSRKGIQVEIEAQERLVNIEDEMAELAKNQIRFEFVARKLRSTYDTIRASIAGHT